MREFSSAKFAAKHKSTIDSFSTMLPEPALYAIVENMNCYSMSTIIRLSQINQKCRRFFLSDGLWARFDVHQVRGNQTVYTFEGYTLHGIAAHYFNYLTSLAHHHRVWHFADPFNTYGHYTPEDRFPLVILGDLYTDMNALCFLGNSSIQPPYNWPPDRTRGWNWGREYFFRNIDQTVWQLFWTYPNNARWNLNWELFTGTVHSKEVYLNLLRKLRPSCPMKILPGYENDRDVNLAMAETGHVYACSLEFQTDPEFMFEAIRLRPLNIAANELARETSFVERVLKENPGVIDAIERRLGSGLLERFHHDRHLTLEMFPAWVRNRASFVKAVLPHHYYLNNGDTGQFKYASEELRDDEDFVLWAIAVQCFNGTPDFGAISARLLKSKEFALKATRLSDEIWPHLSSELRYDADVIAQAMRSECREGELQKLLQRTRGEEDTPPFS